MGWDGLSVRSHEPSLGKCLGTVQAWSSGEELGWRQASGECPCEAGSQPQKNKETTQGEGRLEKGEVVRTEPRGRSRLTGQGGWKGGRTREGSVQRWEA